MIIYSSTIGSDKSDGKIVALERRNIYSLVQNNSPKFGAGNHYNMLAIQ